MKKLVLLLLLIIPIGLSAQGEKERPSKSKTIMFQEKSGIILEKKFYDIEDEKVQGVAFQNIIVTDLSTGEKQGALRLKTSYYSKTLNNSETYIGTLDYDELDACIKSLEYMQQNIINQTPDTYTECEYKSRDGVTISVFSGKKGWTIYLRTKDYTSRSVEYVNIDKLPAIITNMKTALSQLKNELQ